MKKTITLLLAMTLTISLAACGGGSKSTSTSTPYVPGGTFGSGGDTMESDVNSSNSFENEQSDLSETADVSAPPIVRDNNYYLMISSAYKSTTGRDRLTTYDRDEYGRVMGEYVDGRQVAEYGYDDSGNQMTNWKTSGDERYYYYEHEFNADGDLIYYERYKSRAAMQFEYLFRIEHEYDSDECVWRKIQRRYTIGPYNNEEYLSATQTWEYDEDTNFLTSFIDDSDLLNQYSLRYLYDEGSMKIYKTTLQDDEFLVEDNTFDSKDRLIYQKIWSTPTAAKSGSPSSEISYQYNTNDQCMRRDYIASSSHTYTLFFYDDYGNLISAENYSSDGKLNSVTEYEYIAVDCDEFFKTGNFSFRAQLNYVRQIVFENFNTYTSNNPQL